MQPFPSLIVEVVLGIDHRTTFGFTPRVAPSLKTKNQVRLQHTLKTPIYNFFLGGGVKSSNICTILVVKIKVKICIQKNLHSYIVINISMLIVF